MRAAAGHGPHERVVRKADERADAGHDYGSCSLSV
jgi:hypothetical protein